MKIRSHCCALAVLASLASLSSPADAGTDRKLVSGLVCTAENHGDRDKLRYLARGVVATAEVTVLCPLLRDSTLSGLKSLQVNFQRGLKQTPQGQSPDGGSAPFQGRLYACSSTEHVSAANEPVSCPSVTASSDPSRLVEDLDFINPALPLGEGQIYVFRVTLFKNTILKSLVYTEKE